MFKITDLQQYFDEAKSNSIAFEGKCHDCETDVVVNVDMADDGAVTIEGGSLYRPDLGVDGKEKIFLKCDTCYKKDPELRNYRPCEVFSRVCGYLRPVKQYNKGKQAEFKLRKTFDVKQG